MKFKYNINHQISLLPRQISIENVAELLEQEHGISKSTFNRDRFLTIGDSTSIPVDRLDVYAALFGVASDSLKNYKVDVTPISQRDPSNLMKKISKRTGLKLP